MARISDSPNIHKDANKFDLTGISLPDFSLTKGLLSSFKISIDSITFVEENLFQQKFTPRLGSDFW